MTLSSVPQGWLVLGAAADPALVVLPGFLTPPDAYRSLLAPVADAGFRVIVPLLAGRGPRMALGRVSPHHEAALVVELVAREAERGPVALAGHSRGGFVAWLAAVERPPAALIAIDPVAGGGPPWRPATPPPTLPAGLRPLVIGCGVGGPCAPDGRNHRVFAESAPDAEHVVLDGVGHADMLDGRLAPLGRRLCSAGPDPAEARRRITALMLAHLLAEPAP